MAKSKKEKERRKDKTLHRKLKLSDMTPLKIEGKLGCPKE